MEQKIWDAIVGGGGVAGLSAALMLGRARRRVLVIDTGEPRNRYAAHMHGVLGHEGIDPAELLRRGRRECADYGVEFLEGRVDRVDSVEGTLRIALAGGGREIGRTLVVASGITDQVPDIPGLAERWGSAVFHCPYCHGWEVRDQKIGVLPTTPTSVHQIELLRQWTDRVVAFTAALGEIEPETRERWEARGIEVVTEPVEEVLGESGKISAVRLTDGREVALDAIFTAPVPRANEDFLMPLDLARTEMPFGSFVQVDMTGKTSHPRIWAAGNIVMPPGNVPLSMGAGSMAGGAANAMLVTEEFDTAVFWERRYGEADRIWSGEPNAALVDAVQALEPGTALDLGCGEGADTIWLGKQGWQVTGLDLSATAIARAESAARSAKTEPGSVEFIAADITAWADERTFDLVSASFLHSPVSFPRADVLRGAAERVAPGGHLVIVSHATVPPWAKGQRQHEGHDPDEVDDGFLTVEEEIEELALDQREWTLIAGDTRARDAVGPQGEHAELHDNVIVMRRGRG